MRLTIEIDTSEVEKALGSKPVQRAIRAWIPEAAVYVREAMKAEIRRLVSTFGRTGFLASSVTMEVGGDGFSVGPTAEYALWVDQPTKPHVIEAKPGHMLAFAARVGLAPGFVAVRTGIRKGKPAAFHDTGGRPAQGSMVFRQRVMHPGTRGKFFLDSTAAEVVDTLASKLDRNLNEALEAP